MLWYRFSLLDWFLVEKLQRKPLCFNRFAKRILSNFKDYDLLIAHSLEGAFVANQVYKEYGIPYFVTWHGSDIHTHPMHNRFKLRMTAEVMDQARCNFFVSQTLMAQSDYISESAPKSVLYNAASDAFRRFDDAERKELRRKYNITDGEKVVAFAGNLVRVKNAAILPELFHRIGEEYEEELKFLVIGDGKLRNKIEPELLGDATIDVQFLGNVPAGDMPQLMNCVDVLVLPSLNEGLPLVAVEGLKCGANVIGSYVGGIPEAIGREFCVHLSDPPAVPADSRFVNSMAVKVASLLHAPKPQSISESFSWEKTARAELETIRELM